MNNNNKERYRWTVKNNSIFFWLAIVRQKLLEVQSVLDALMLRVRLTDRAK